MIRADDEIAALLAHVTDAVVFQANDVDDDWNHVATELKAAFDATRPAAIEGHPVVYIVSSDALLGRTGAGNAMVATGLLSAARTLAVEMARARVPVNVLGVGPDTQPATIATWAERLLEPGGPTGELLQLEGTQIGKALP
jgi:NAD(P)-dependent dehydrogenase (short-subunit alcohol dehydrogenase family)